MPVVMVTKSEEDDDAQRRDRRRRSPTISSSRSTRARSSRSSPGCSRATASASSGSRATSSTASASSRPGAAATSTGAAGSSWSSSSPSGTCACGQAGEPGLHDSLRTLQDSLRHDFAALPQAQLRRLAATTRDSDRPAALGRHRRRIPAARPRAPRQGACSSSSTACGSTSGRCSAPLIAPLSTSRRRTTSRSCRPPRRSRGTRSSAGSFPARSRRASRTGGATQDETPQRARGASCSTRSSRTSCGAAVPVRYEKIFTAADGDDCSSACRPTWRSDGRDARSSSTSSTCSPTAAPRLRPCTRWRATSPRCGSSRAPGSSARRCSTRCARRRGGRCRCCSPPTTARSTATRRRRCSPSATRPSNLRYKFGEDLRAEDPEAALVVDDLPSFGLPAAGAGHTLCSRPATASSSIRRSCASTRPATAARSSTAASPRRK